jgi:hypothetical protein
VVIRTAAVLCAAVVFAACGPIEYINQVTRHASREVAAAKAAGAEKYAPYEYTSAVELLHKAREEEGYAEHQAAVRFGKKAEEMAKKAKQIALEQAGTEAQPAGEAPIDPSSSPATPGSSSPPELPEGGE